MNNRILQKFLSIENDGAGRENDVPQATTINDISDQLGEKFINFGYIYFLIAVPLIVPGRLGMLSDQNSFIMQRVRGMETRSLSCDDWVTRC